MRSPLLYIIMLLLLYSLLSPPLSLLSPLTAHLTLPVDFDDLALKTWLSQSIFQKKKKDFMYMILQKQIFDIALLYMEGALINSFDFMGTACILGGALRVIETHIGALLSTLPLPSLPFPPLSLPPFPSHIQYLIVVWFRRFLLYLYLLLWLLLLHLLFLSFFVFPLRRFRRSGDLMGGWLKG